VRYLPCPFRRNIYFCFLEYLRNSRGNRLSRNWSIRYQIIFFHISVFLTHEPLSNVPFSSPHLPHSRPRRPLNVIIPPSLSHLPLSSKQKQIRILIHKYPQSRSLNAQNKYRYASTTKKGESSPICHDPSFANCLPAYYLSPCLSLIFSSDPSYEHLLF
jgi:hypothetical protein